MKSTGSLIAKLFDYQKFSPNSRLSELISGVLDSCEMPEEIEENKLNVWAAGDTDSLRAKKDSDDVQ